jgi:hypothetical protein
MVTAQAVIRRTEHNHHTFQCKGEWSMKDTAIISSAANPDPVDYVINWPPRSGSEYMVLN